MPQQWMSREVERQEFLNELMNRIYHEQEEKEKLHPDLSWERWCLSLIPVMTGSLANWRHHKRLSSLAEDGFLGIVSDFFHNDIVPAIEKFGRTHAERAYLLAELFGKIARAAQCSFCHELHREEMAHVSSAPPDLSFD